MKIKLNNVLVNDQDKAFMFYTEILGFVKKNHIPEIRWLTVVSPGDVDGAELLLEPNDHDFGKTYQEALSQRGIPAALFAVDDIEQEYERLEKLGVKFRMNPTKAGDVIIAKFDDTCGNFIQLYQV